ncbi:PNGase F N-terminal domain-containing protein [Roseateles aquae]|uniref:PNGase F N-terminal domain-containing protein n=1 Tax=Roseateles aquae TaxID=3077235 RepID=UPI0028ED388D|nr:PNGase F N-terminal domain-containing protein [Paucibacter sp. APW11]
MTLRLSAIVLIGLCIWAFAAPAAAAPTEGLKLHYQRTYNGKPVEGEDAIVLLAARSEALISAEAVLAGKAAFPHEQTLVKPAAGELLQLARLNSSETIATLDREALGKQRFELIESEGKTILGHRCRIARTVVNSNTIELCYTNELPVAGAPTVLGHQLGLVLELVRNGNFVIRATQIEAFLGLDLGAMAQGGSTDEPFVAPALLDGPSYKDRLWKSRFTTIPVFQDQIVNFSEQDREPREGVTRYANGTVVLKTLQLPEIQPGSQVFVDLLARSNGDAYDRTGSVFVIPLKSQGHAGKRSFMDGLQYGVAALPLYQNGNGRSYRGVVATEGYAPLIELMRFFTPFGVKHFNHLQLKGKTWHEAVPYRMDITDIATRLSGQTVAVGVFIGNYDQGGHKIDLNLTIHASDAATAMYSKPQEHKPAASPVLIPLFNTTNVMEMAKQDYATMFDVPKGLEVKFTLARPLKNARLRYIATGHGGWTNGDEFQPKKNTLLLDGKPLFAFVPWRQDCGAYRLFNPASGNFNDGLSSSDLSRSNWCPGTATNPVYIDLGDLKAGRHVVSVRIPQGAREGESFSAWNVSGVVVGE